MLEKKADIGVGKDEEGWVIVDQKTKKGVRVPEESLMQLTLIIWEFCDKEEPEDIVKRIVGDAKIEEEQMKMVKQVVKDSLEVFVKAGWAVAKKKTAKKK